MQSRIVKSPHPAIFFRADRLNPILISHRFRKVPFSSVHTETRKRRFKKFHAGMRSHKVSFSVTVFIGNVWTEAISATKKLRFQAKTDTCKRRLKGIQRLFSVEFEIRYYTRNRILCIFAHLSVCSRPQKVQGIFFRSIKPLLINRGV